jgi:hypothetical protein
LDGPFAVVYPWAQDEPGVPESIVQIRREIRAMDVVRNFGAMNCPAMLMLCSIAANTIEQRMLPARLELAEHVAQHHSGIRIEWVKTGHDTILFQQPEEIAARIHDFIASSSAQRKAVAPNGGPAASVDNSNAPDGPPSVS